MLPKNLRYTGKVESSASRSYRSSIAPQNGTGNYGFGDTIIINVPSRQNLVLATTESYLKFNVNFTNGATAANNLRWDSCGAHSVIQRIRIFHGSNCIEDTDNYALLAKLMFDLQVSTDASMGKHNVLTGTRNDLVATLPALTAGATYAQADMTLLNASKISCLQINSGDTLGSLGANAASVTQTYCLNLVSLMGTLCANNYFPLFACTSAPIRMEIQLVDSAIKCVTSLTGVTGMTLNNCEYIANYIELSDSAMSLIYGSLNGAPLQFCTPSYRNYQFNYNLGESQTQVSMPINAKFSSLKSIFITVRDKGTGALTYFPHSSCTKKIIDYVFRVGSQIMPPKAPNTLPEMFSEVLKAIGSMSDNNHQPSIEKYSYGLQDSVAHTLSGNTNSGSFYIGLDLENYANCNKDSIFAGYNSNTDDIYAIMNFDAQAAATNVRFDAFAMFDEVVVFENNTCYVKF
jgi:hypothetical protein